MYIENENFKQNAHIKIIKGSIIINVGKIDEKRNSAPLKLKFFKIKPDVNPNVNPLNPNARKQNGIVYIKKEHTAHKNTSLKFSKTHFFIMLKCDMLPPLKKNAFTKSASSFVWFSSIPADASEPINIPIAKITNAIIYM